MGDATNIKMHHGMAINFTGDVRIDFVRGMIPHHQGAVDMCKVLVSNLTCLTWEDTDQLDGLVHFCNHVNLEQQRELAGMRNWLATQQLMEHAMCSNGAMGQSTNHANMDHSMHGSGHSMSDGCGHTSSPSSKQFIELNYKMHFGMAVNFSCNHAVDFVRAMIPHHAGAVAMCEVLANHSGT